MRTGFGVGDLVRVRDRERVRSRRFGGGVLSPEPLPRRRGDRERLAERDRSRLRLLFSTKGLSLEPARRTRSLERLRRSRSRSGSLRALLAGRGDFEARLGERERDRVLGLVFSLSLAPLPAPPRRRFFSLRSESLDELEEELEESLELLELERELPELLRDELLSDELEKSNLNKTLNYEQANMLQIIKIRLRNVLF